MDYRIKEIKQKVFAENQAREIISKVVPKIIEVLKPYADKDIKQEVIDKLKDENSIKLVLKKDYTLLKKITEELKPLLDRDIPIKPFKEGDVAKIDYLYISSNEYDIHLHFKINYIGEDYNFYYESYKYICSIKNRAIEKFYDLGELKLLNEEEEMNLYNQAKEKQEELNAIKDKMFYAFRSFI